MNAESAPSVQRGFFEILLEKHGFRIWGILVGFFVLYILLPPLLLVAVSFNPSGRVQVPTGFSLRWYDVMIQTKSLIDALVKSILLAFLTTVITTLLAVQTALGYRKTRFKTLVIAVMVLPIFLPGLIQGFSLSLLLIEFGGLQRSIWTELAGHVMWALPFAFLVVLTSMSAVNRETLLAAMDLGANEWRAFKDIEYPIIKPGITSAAIFSFVLSFNEFSRTYYLQGIGQTIPTYVWNKITVSITPEIFALSSITVILSLSLIAIATVYLTMVGRVAKSTEERTGRTGLRFARRQKSGAALPSHPEEA
jgi:spermidine/putrescine transport system permease protein